MDMSACEWSSGCESGWTDYLNESYHSPNKYHQPTHVLDAHHLHQSYRSNGKSEYEEDLSMVSDASSGPPLFGYGAQEVEVEEEDEEVDCYKKKTKKKKSKAKEATKAMNQHSFLDDTASSPAFTYPNANMYMDPSMSQQSMNHHQQQQPHLYGYSQENGYMGSSAYGNQYGMWQSTYPNHQDSTQSSRSRGRRRG